MNYKNKTKDSVEEKGYGMYFISLEKIDYFSVKMLLFMFSPEMYGKHALMLSSQERKSFLSFASENNEDKNLLDFFQKLFPALDKLDENLGKEATLEEKIEALKDDKIRQIIKMNDGIYQIFVESNPKFFPKLKKSEATAPVEKGQQQMSFETNNDSIDKDQKIQSSDSFQKEQNQSNETCS